MLPLKSEMEIDENKKETDQRAKKNYG